MANLCFYVLLFKRYSFQITKIFDLERCSETYENYFVSFVEPNSHRLKANIDN